MEDEWEIADLKSGRCRMTLSIRKDSRYRNTYCTSCRTAHLWKRIDQKEFHKRINNNI